MAVLEQSATIVAPQTALSPSAAPERRASRTKSVTTLHCLVVSTRLERRQMLERAAGDAGWDVIVCDESIAGYVRQTSGNIDDLKIYALGWNLAPEFWGNGVMTHSLTQLLNDLRNPTGRTLFVADCFQSNERCVSLLNRLEFAPWKIGIGEQFAGMLKNKCLKWVLRFCLQKENPNVSAE